MLFFNIISIYVAYFAFAVGLLYVIYLFANRITQKYLVLKKEEIQVIKELIEAIKNKE